MRRRGNVIQGRFGGRGRVSALPPELTVLLRAERKKRTWRRYLPVWGGAVAVGLIVGAGPSLLPRATTVTAAPQPTAIPTTSLEAPSAADRQLAARAGDGGSTAPSAAVTRFGFCHTGGSSNCVVDGDTLWIGGEKVRVADIDAPETHDFRCPEEKALGDRATQRLIQLVNSGPVSVEPIDRDKDVYGRKLRIVLVNGTSVGETLVSEGLARFYGGGRRPWC